MILDPCFGKLDPTLDHSLATICDILHSLTKLVIITVVMD